MDSLPKSRLLRFAGDELTGNMGFIEETWTADGCGRGRQRSDANRSAGLISLTRKGGN